MHTCKSYTQNIHSITREISWLFSSVRVTLKKIFYIVTYENCLFPFPEMHHSDFRLYDHPRLCFILYSGDISNACHHRDTLKAKTHHLIGEQSSVAYIPRIIASIFSAKKKKTRSIYHPLIICTFSNEVSPQLITV